MVEEIGFPHLVDYGLRVQSQIISDDLMMKNLVSKVNEILKSLGVEHKTFEDQEEGNKWVNQFIRPISWRLLLIEGVAMASMLPDPTWFNIIDLTGVLTYNLVDKLKINIGLLKFMG